MKRTDLPSLIAKTIRFYGDRWMSHGIQLFFDSFTLFFKVLLKMKTSRHV